MKLLFDLNSLRPPRSGIGYYTQHLLEGLLRRSDVEDVAGWVGRTVFQGERLDAMMVDQSSLQKAVQFRNGMTASLLQKSRAIPGLYRLRTVVRSSASRTLRSDFARRGYLYHETNFVASRYRGPNVVTVHDLSHRRHPEFHPQVAVNYLDHGLPRSLRQAGAIIVDSLYTKQELLDIYDVPEERVVPIHLGVEPVFRPYSEEECRPVLDALGIQSRRFVLSVCTLQPRKNLQRLVEGFARLPEELRQMYPLVLVGADGWKNSQLMACIEPLARAGQIISPGYLSRSSLLHLFSSAAVFAYPSLYEGFGLPVAEAMASGAPVLTSNVTSIPEVTNGAALEVDPYSVDAIEAGLERLLTDAALRDLLVEKGLRRAAELTWDATVEKTCEVYHSLV
ncbi:glycosyltransferase family 1 protein [Burkholderia diffusa]|uniref:glycosyltransferase family 4 protein n=1 Tax=Burkholderia diffusa TaxID=488732 RepID=UPI00264C4F27|nr:glycosyltransferase family 1 protein [Burkholderia diffusa]MDN7906866.1 glycosyltransferase family 1 protein [Burkholderia diffusa]